MKLVYSSLQPLRCSEFPNLKRALGVGVWRYDNNGHHDVSYERLSLTVNTATFGKGTSLDGVQIEVIKQTTAVIEHLDNVIAELKEHRARLATELDNINQNGITYNMMAEGEE